MRLALLYVELSAETSGEVDEESRAVGLSGADLEVRVAGPAQGAGSEKRAAEIRGRAAAAGDDARGRAVKRAMGAAEDAGAVQRVVGSVRSLDVELVARRVV